MTRGWWLALVLALGSVQLGCGEEDRDHDGVASSEDCDDSLPGRWKRVMLYADPDGDGVGSGSASGFCAGEGVPQGFAAQTGDCAPQDRSRWREQDGLYLDADRDGVATGQPLRECVGTSLAGYLLTKDAEDCDDTNPKVWRLLSVYLDEDKDGAMGGALVPRCTGDTAPPDTSETATDCAPQDAARYTLVPYAFRDADFDGFTVPEEGRVCGGLRLPPGYASQPSALTDCDDTSGQRWQLLAVYPDPDTDGVGSGTVEQQCSGDNPPLGYGLKADDCAPEDGLRWQSRPYSHRDADGDGATVAESGQVCSGQALPRGYATVPGPNGADCDDTQASLRVTWNVFPDTDNDGVGTGSRVAVCASTTRPAGYSDSDTDCAPDDASRWRGLTYQYRDADGDRFTIAAGGSLCAGTSLPPGYTNVAHGNDCDDTRASVHRTVQAWPDEDADGVGAGTASSFCTDGSVPAGYSSLSTDCAPDTALRWQTLAYQHVDLDEDGTTAPASGSVCTGATLPLPYFASPSGNDCDDADPRRSLWRVLYPDQDGDGVGAPPRTVSCLDSSQALPSGISRYGFDPDDSNPDVKDVAEDPVLDVLLLEK